MKFLTKFILILSLFVTCFACDKRKPARIINNNHNFYSKNSRHKASASTRALQSLNNKSQIQIIEGNTLYGIAKEYQVTTRDLIKYNNLTPPYILKSGDKLTIPAPNYYQVKAGDSLYGISRAHNMKIDQLIELNDLKPPYTVQVGMKIRISEESANLTKKEKYNSESSKESAEKKSNSGFVASAMDKLSIDRFSNFSWPVQGKVISDFGPKSDGLYNDGINIAAKEGVAVKSVKDGVVAYVGNELKGYGNLIIVKHSGGWIAAYAHLQSSIVQRGQKVSKGEKIGTVGSTGNVKSPQLYFGLRKGRDAVNPANYLK